MIVTLELRKEGLSLAPQEEENPTRPIIEVYPGIIEQGPHRKSPAMPAVARHLPPHLTPGTDK